jgi:uncharacterized protein YbaA (DUF1428 family)
MSYVDGFVLPIPKKNLPAYRRMAQKASAIWLELGAVEYRECVLDDGDCSFGVSFPKLAGAKRGDTVVFAWIVYKSRAHRDRVNKKVMADPRIAAMMPDPKKAPFDCTKMAYGGFKTIVEA